MKIYRHKSQTSYDMNETDDVNLKERTVSLIDEQHYHIGYQDKRDETVIKADADITIDKLGSRKGTITIKFDMEDLEYLHNIYIESLKKRVEKSEDDIRTLKHKLTKQQNEDNKRWKFLVEATEDFDIANRGFNTFKTFIKDVSEEGMDYIPHWAQEAANRVQDDD